MVDEIENQKDQLFLNYLTLFHFIIFQKLFLLFTSKFRDNPKSFLLNKDENKLIIEIIYLKIMRYRFFVAGRGIYPYYQEYTPIFNKS